MNQKISLTKSIIHDLNILGSESYQNPQKGTIFTAILLNSQGITQDEIIILTDLPRTIVSESLTSLRNADLVKIKKFPKDRKTYYQSQIAFISAFRLYLRNLLSKFKENVDFSQNILAELENLSESEQKIAAYSHFKDYLKLFQQQNDFVIQYFEAYLSGSNIPPKIDSNQRIQLMNHLQLNFHKIIEATTQIPTNNNPEPTVSKNVDHIQKIDHIKKLYIQKFRNLMEKTDKNTLYPSVVNLLYIEDLPPTQDRMLELLEIPRSTLSDALKKVEGDRLIRSNRFISDKKLHYYPRVPRKLLLSTKFFAMIRQLFDVLQKLRNYLPLVSPELKDTAGIHLFLQEAIQEYESLVDFLFYLEAKLDETFNLGLQIP